MLEVFLYKTDAMKKILLHVSNGYTRYTSGKVDPKSLSKLALTYDDRYNVTATKQVRYRAKAKDKANSHLVMFYDPNSKDDNAYWWLLVSENGEGLVTEHENLVDARSKKNRIKFGGYELLRIQRVEGKPRVKNPNPTKKTTIRPTSKVRWTWQCLPEIIQILENEIFIFTSQKNDMKIRQLIHTLNQMPCFHETRKQAYKCYALLKKRYKKQHGFDITEKYGEFKKSYYGRYTKATTIPLDKLSSRLKTKALKEQKALEIDALKVEKANKELRYKYFNELKVKIHSLGDIVRNATEKLSSGDDPDKLRVLVDKIYLRQAQFHDTFIKELKTLPYFDSDSITLISNNYLSYIKELYLKFTDKFEEIQSKEIEESYQDYY